MYRGKNKFKYRGYIYQAVNNFDLKFRQLWNNRQRLNCINLIIMVKVITNNNYYFLSVCFQFLVIPFHAEEI